jgi:hypothetical protein
LLFLANTAAALAWVSLLALLASFSPQPSTSHHVSRGVDSPSQFALKCTPSMELGLRPIRVLVQLRIPVLSPRKVNHPVQGTGADGLKLAMALFHERLPKDLEACLILAVHDELVVECPEAQANEVASFLEEIMVAGMDEVINPGLAADHPERIPVGVDVEVVESWGG